MMGAGTRSDGVSDAGCTSVTVAGYAKTRMTANNHKENSNDQTNSMRRNSQAITGWTYGKTWMGNAPEYRMSTFTNYPA
jgi:hypothetical protein